MLRSRKTRSGTSGAAARDSQATNTTNRRALTPRMPSVRPEVQPASLPPTMP